MSQTAAHPMVSFFTKGTRTQHKESYIISNQSYVGYLPAQVPAHPKAIAPIPILFVHGGGLTGAMWESTPDRRPGWAANAAAKGYHAYMIDTVDSGRSQRAPDALRAGGTEHRTAKYVWDRFRIGSAQAFKAREPFEDSQFPVEHFDALIAAQSARRRNTDDVQTAALVEAVRTLGTCHIIAHSHGAALVMDAIDALKDHVSHLVLVEPGETANPETLKNQVTTLVVWGDYLDSNPVWVKIESGYRRKGIESMSLPSLGVKGNSHFLMLEKNSSQIFDRILKWIEGA